MPRKLRLSVNNPQASSERPLSPPVYVTQYHWPRIIVVGVVLLGLITGLYFWSASDDMADAKGLSSDGAIPVEQPASGAAGQPPVFAEPESADRPSSTATNAAASSSSGQTDASGRQKVPVPRDTSHERSFGSDRPLAEALSDQVDARLSAGTGSVMAPESESERSRYRLTVQDEPAKKPAAVQSAAPPVEGPSPEGIMTMQSDKVVRAMLTDGISNSEPAALLSDPVKIVDGRSMTIHLFAEIMDSRDEALQLLWFHAGKSVMSLPLTLHSQKAVVTSSITISGSQAGEWQVEIRDKAGKALASGHFQVTIQ